jgi:hypothetical protein
MKKTGVGYKLFCTALFGIVLAGGCTVKNKGTPHENSPPRVFFSTVPVAGTVFTKPDQFFWFALDRDGYITEFQYALIPDSIIQLVNAPAGAEDSVVRRFLKIHPVDSDTIWRWVTVDNIFRNAQTDTIALPTSTTNPNDTSTRNSVIFVRARDDRGVFSTDPWLAINGDTSKFDAVYAAHANAIAWRHFGRKNRPPKTHFRSIGVCNRPRFGSPGLQPIFYSRDFNTYDTSAFMRVGHCGITIEWFGSDSVDYPNQEQPDFAYFWELFGPFPSSQTAFPDTNRLWASATYPKRWHPDSGSAARRTFDSVTSVTFFGLKGFDTLTNYRVGYYLFRVRARDDAGVIAPTSGTSVNIFGVVHPRFDRDILLVHKATFDGGRLKNVPPYGFIPDASTPPQESVQIQNHYLKLIRDAGYGGHIDSALDIKYYQGEGPGGNVPESLLARYKLVIFHKERAFPSIGTTNLLQSLKYYMDAGGSVWGMGRDDLSDVSGFFPPAQPAEIPFNLFDPTFGVGYFYFGIERLFYHAHTVKMAQDSFTREEFVGADLTRFSEPEGFPSIDVDTNVIMRYTVASPPRRDSTPYRRMPGVNYFVRQPRSEELYLFRSPIGVADTSHLHGKVVAVRADRRFSKSAYFGFPLYGIKEEQATQVMQKMLNWFIGPPTK